MYFSSPNTPSGVYVRWLQRDWRLATCSLRHIHFTIMVESFQATGWGFLLRHLGPSSGFTSSPQKTQAADENSLCRILSPQYQFESQRMALFWSDWGASRKVDNINYIMVRRSTLWWLRWESSWMHAGVKSGLMKSVLFKNKSLTLQNSSPGKNLYNVKILQIKTGIASRPKVWEPVH